ncbi:60s ribosomal protein l38 (yml38) [Trichosporon asahii var. asahii CBS 8904]|uniref:60s ribosomal protein l38 (Yml38) n=2 Tax=Trichosporon asahii var. asahii TaxID=189963 RepID=K1VMG4_TRIAC|nr:60s ribosomal protein l38 (yml38) [Trichosporon asahii var. asahii CBS 2479]EJT45208.1 60s ribosomal protein l38 (yml38) [Trichosporon asahii var. asahii CBS 2479]EKD00562.1 60s ribosomal protein l38 (yml38) [Trichosporon asahii var. asahii CBS 8904]
MIGLKGRMNVIDNSGAVIAECINVLKVKTRQHADGKATVGECTYAWLPECSRAFESEYMGLKRRCPSEGSVKLVRGYLGPAPGGLNVERSDEIVCVVNKAKPISNISAASNVQKVRRGDVRRAVVVRTRKELQRPDGRIVRFDDNACVLLNNKGEMLGTRVTGVVAAELAKATGADGNGRWSKILSLAPKVV